MFKASSSAARQRWLRHPLARGSGALLALALVAASAAPSWAASLDELAARLSTLRGDVESLSAELASMTADGRDELRSLARQKADLELELKKEEIRIQKLRAALAQKREAIERSEGRDQDMIPLFDSQLEVVRGYVAGSLPFRTEQRLGELDTLEEQLRSGLVTPPRALSRLWNFVEDEFRLTRESGLYQQTIRLDGQELLADVVRIGSVAMFFQTSGGKVGRVIRQGDGYAWQPVRDPLGAAQIVELFDAFRKQIRAGYFELPNAFSARVAP